MLKAKSTMLDGLTIEDYKNTGNFFAVLEMNEMDYCYRDSLLNHQYSSRDPVSGEQVAWPCLLPLRFLWAV